MFDECLLNFYWRTANGCRSDRSRSARSHRCLVPKFGIDTAENEPLVTRLLLVLPRPAAPLPDSAAPRPVHLRPPPVFSSGKALVFQMQAEVSTHISTNGIAEMSSRRGERKQTMGKHCRSSDYILRRKLFFSFWRKHACVDS